jgi:hypothetical protein
VFLEPCDFAESPAEHQGLVQGEGREDLGGRVGAGFGGAWQAEFWALDFLWGIEKAALGAAFFVSYSLLLEYQIWGETAPKFFGGFGMEVFWNVGEHFGTVREKLDKNNW